MGRVYGSSVGYDLPSGDTLQPDLTFVTNERLANAPRPQLGEFGKVVPDLVVEILSRSTAGRDRGEKKDIYVANGVREYWIVDPERQTVTVFHSRGADFDAGVVYARGAAESQILPGLETNLSELFEP